MTIDGFHIEMTGKELIAELQQLAKAHNEQADEHGRRVRDRLERDPPRQRSGFQRPERDTRECHRERERAVELRFLAEHVVADATYRLDADDIEYLELTDVRLRRTP